MNRRWTRALAIAVSIAVLVALKFSMAAEPDDKGAPAEPPDRPAGAPAEPEAKKFTGTVAQFNYTPRGERDGILLTSDGKLVQLNFPPHEAGKLTGTVAVGDQITAEATPERARADHAVLHLQKLTTVKGKEIEMAGPRRPRGPEGGRGAGRGDGPEQTGSTGRERALPKTETVKGVVKSLNRGARGEVDGATLESGDFVHIGPREAEEAKLAVGQEISVEGYAMKMADGHTMISFPVKINDKEVSRPGPGHRGVAADRRPPSDGDAPPRGEAPPPDEK
ncbi:MAG TPA: hypothetical protein VHX65_15840 [Pirellulales bacterium]|nr:hypothetical protein [Pirellulales bacterium]